MRTYGRVYDANGQNPKWVVIQTDANGFNDAVYLTTLIQVFKLNLGESPFYSQYGIPAQQTLVQQVAPDFYVMRTQSQFAQYFANLSCARNPTSGNPANPTYTVNVTTHVGAKLNLMVAT